MEMERREQLTLKLVITQSIIFFLTIQSYFLKWHLIIVVTFCFDNIIVVTFDLKIIVLEP